MLILITTANFPDVMMPAYKDSFSYSLYFIGFLMFGLFILMNMLLANVYNKFMSRFEDLAQNNTEKRMKSVNMILDRYDPKETGYLSRSDTEDFVSSVKFGLGWGGSCKTNDNLL